MPQSAEPIHERSPDCWVGPQPCRHLMIDRSSSPCSCHGGPERQGRPRPDGDREPGPGPGLVHVWSTRHQNRAVRNGSSGASLAQVTGSILGQQARVQNPDKDGVTAVIGLALPGRPIQSLVAEGGVPEASATTGPHPSVRTGSVPQRSITGIGGHQRSRMVQRNRRSSTLQLIQLR